MVNQQTLAGKWNDVKGELKKKWGSLTDDDVTTFNGNVDQLVGKIQQKSGDTRDSIEKYLNQLTEDGSGMLGGVRDKLQDGARYVADTARASSDKIRDGVNQAGQMVQDHPGQTVAAAFGLGLIVGVGIAAMLHSRPPESMFSRGRAMTGDYMNRLADKLSGMVGDLKKYHS